MKIGILQFEMRIPTAQSLKDKRRVVKSIKDRLHREHMVSVAEVGGLEVWNNALMGLVAVSSDGRYLHNLLDRIVGKLSAWPDSELGDFSIDVVGAENLDVPAGGEAEPLWTPDERREPADADTAPPSLPRRRETA